MADKTTQPQVPATFTVQSTTILPEINATLIQLKHPATGAKFVHIEAQDSNNLFAVAFKTPPTDSTGVAHILEHTALCGSTNYPVRDPFFTMLKRSLNTFMNAFTASDWTCYPFSSQNHKDFYNLLNIYLDAAFFPLLREMDFKQEGHRLEFEQQDDATSPLTFKGIVFNEMKGAMADPASLLSRRTTRHLYPTTCYHHNSGGEPEDIPNLSWQQLRDFHAEYYHPSNACFFSYGDFSLAEHLQVIETQVLNKFSASPANSEVAPEQRLTAPVNVCETFPIGADENLQGKSMVHLSWLTSDIADSFNNLALTLLSQLLIGNPAAPLYKALLDSGLGTNLTPGCGFHDDYRTTCFAVGLQGTDCDKTEQIEDLILTTLRDIAATGFTQERIEATIHRLELANREVGGDSYPYAISLMFRILGPWIHCNDPISALQLDDNLTKLRHKLTEGRFFEDLIHTWLLDNNHRITLCLRPDPELGSMMEQQERQRLDAINTKLSDNDKQQIIEQAQQLQQSQEHSEDLSCLPTLQLSDIDKDESQTTSTSATIANTTVTMFDQPTNGLGYFNLYFNCASLDEKLQPYLPLFTSLLTQVGAADYSYVEMAQRIEASTGGISASIDIFDNLDSLDSFQPWLHIRGKALERNLLDMSKILADVCATANFNDLDRLATLIGQIKSSWENAIPGAGHSYAARTAAAMLTPAGAQREQWFGLTQLKFIKKIAKLETDQLAELAQKMTTIASTLIVNNHLHAAITTEERSFSIAKQAMDSLLQIIPHSDTATSSETPKPAATTPATTSNNQLGWATSIPVSYVTRLFRTVPFAHPDSAPLKILAALLKANFLHREIREKGGAYGGMANSSSEAGIFSMLSYRDPHLLRTLDIYDQSIEWLQQGDFNDETINEAVLSVFSGHDRPLSPSGRALNEFANQIQGLSYEKRQQFRQRMLAVTKEQLLEVAQHYLVDQQGSSPIAILSNNETLQAAAAELPQLTIEQI